MSRGFVELDQVREELEERFKEKKKEKEKYLYIFSL